MSADPVPLVADPETQSGGVRERVSHVVSVAVSLMETNLSRNTLVLTGLQRSVLA